MRALILVSFTLGFLDACAGTNTSPKRDAFHEKLTLRPLPTGQLSYQFHFTIDFASLSPPPTPHEGSEDFEGHHTALAPLSILLPLERNRAKEVHVSIVAGKWRDEWGLPLGNEVGGTGGEVRGWFLPELDVQSGEIHSDFEEQESLHRRWTAVTNALAGLFCSSLGQVTPSTTTSPTSIFRPTSSRSSSSTSTASSRDLDSLHLLHAHLPSESLCTENLTPLLKLLPSKGSSGLSGLMRPYTLLSHGWHAMGVGVVFDDADREEETDWEEPNEDDIRGALIGRGGRVELWWEGVVDIVDLKRDGKRDFSLHSIYQRHLPHRCPVASSSSITLIGPPSLLAIMEFNTPASQARSLEAIPEQSEHRVWEYGDALVGKDLEFRFERETAFSPPALIPPQPISFSRRLMGIDQVDGKIKTYIRNTEDRPRRVIYAEELPWYMGLWMSEMKVEADGEEVGLADESAVTSISHFPAVARNSPTSLNIHLTIPPHAEVAITIPFSKAFIRYTEHPPDASRGFDIPPAILYLDDVVDRNGSDLDLTSSTRQRLYSSKLLLHLSEPDYSMPYNLLLMSGTLLSLLFGSIFNLLIRRYGLVYVPVEKA